MGARACDACWPGLCGRRCCRCTSNLWQLRPCIPLPAIRFHVQRFFAALDANDINKYDPNNHTIGADIPFSQNILASAAARCGAALVSAGQTCLTMQTVSAGADLHPICCCDDVLPALLCCHCPCAGVQAAVH